jgi:hypothetical protein
MWVSRFPIRGLRATWENWISSDHLRFATLHRIGPYRIELMDLRTGSHHGDLGLEKDPFTDFVTQ